MKRIKNLIVFLLGAALATGVIFFVQGQTFTFYEKGKTTVSTEVVEQSFADIAELATETYTSNDVGTLTEEKATMLGGRIAIPFTGKHLVITYDATVKAGVKDISQAKVSFDEAKKTATVRLPRVEILDAFIAPDSIAVIDQSNSIINRVKPEDMAELMESELERAQERAVEEDVLIKATEHSEAVLANHVKAMLHGTTYEGYTIKIEWA